MREGMARNAKQEGSQEQMNMEEEITDLQKQVAGLYGATVAFGDLTVEIMRSLGAIGEIVTDLQQQASPPLRQRARAATDALIQTSELVRQQTDELRQFVQEYKALHNLI
jgi:hypothetical protein